MMIFAWRSWENLILAIWKYIISFKIKFNTTAKWNVKETFIQIRLQLKEVTIAISEWAAYTIILQKVYFTDRRLSNTSNCYNQVDCITKS